MASDLRQATTTSSFREAPPALPRKTAAQMATGRVRQAGPLTFFPGGAGDRCSATKPWKDGALEREVHRSRSYLARLRQFIH